MAGSSPLSQKILDFFRRNGLEVREEKRGAVHK